MTCGPPEWFWFFFFSTNSPGGVASDLPNPGHSRRVRTPVDSRLERHGRSRGLTERSCTWKITDIDHKRDGWPTEGAAPVLGQCIKKPRLNWDLTFSCGWPAVFGRGAAPRHSQIRRDQVRLRTQPDGADASRLRFTRWGWFQSWIRESSLKWFEDCDCEMWVSCNCTVSDFKLCIECAEQIQLQRLLN